MVVEVESVADHKRVVNGEADKIGGHRDIAA
jgi:hypothetical protein